MAELDMATLGVRGLAPGLPMIAGHVRSTTGAGDARRSRRVSPHHCRFARPGPLSRTGPKFIKRGSRVLYRWSDVVEWLLQLEVILRTAAFNSGSALLMTKGFSGHKVTADLCQISILAGAALVEESRRPLLLESRAP